MLLSFKTSVTYERFFNFTLDNCSSDITLFFAEYCPMTGANIQAWTLEGRNIVTYIFLIFSLIIYLIVNKTSIKTLAKSKLVGILLLKKLWRNEYFWSMAEKSASINRKIHDRYICVSWQKYFCLVYC